MSSLCIVSTGSYFEICFPTRASDFTWHDLKVWLLQYLSLITKAVAQSIFQQANPLKSEPRAEKKPRYCIATHVGVYHFWICPMLKIILTANLNISNLCFVGLLLLDTLFWIKALKGNCRSCTDLPGKTRLLCQSTEVVWPYDNFRIINTAVLMWACSCFKFLPVKRQVLSSLLVFDRRSGSGYLSTDITGKNS